MGALRKNFPDPRAVGAALDTALTLAATDTEAEIITSMGLDKHGIHWPGLPHTSSAPGEAPAIQSGNLAGSMQIRPQGGTGVVLVIDNPYAAALEFGRIDGRIAARPFLVPAVHTIAPATWKRMSKALVGKQVK